MSKTKTPDLPADEAAPEVNGDQTKPPRRKPSALQAAGRIESILSDFGEIDTKRILSWVIEGTAVRFPSLDRATRAETLYPPEAAT